MTPLGLCVGVGPADFAGAFCSKRLIRDLAPVCGFSPDFCACVETPVWCAAGDSGGGLGRVAALSCVFFWCEELSGSSGGGCASLGLGWAGPTFFPAAALVGGCLRPAIVGAGGKSSGIVVMCDALCSAPTALEWGACCSAPGRGIAARGGLSLETLVFLGGRGGTGVSSLGFC